MTISLAVWIQYTNVIWNRQTDGRTDGRTDTGRQQKPRLRIASRGNQAFTVKFLRTIMILGIRWHDFVRNTEVVDRINLPCVQDIIAKRQNSLFGHVVRLDDHTPAQGALITGCSSQNWPPLWSWLAATARTPAPFMDPADRRRYTFQHSCRMVQGSSSWPLWVDATDLCCLHDLMMMMMMLLLR